MYNIRLNGQNKTITLQKVQRSIKLYQTGRQGPQGPPGTTSGPQTYSQFVYNSSTTQEDNRYSVWQDLVDAINDGQGGKVTISFEQSETIPAGEYYLPNVVWSGNGVPPQLGGVILTFAEGVVLTETDSFTQDNGIAIGNLGSQPVMTVTQPFRYEADNASFLAATDAPFFRFEGNITPTITLGLGCTITNMLGAAPLYFADTSNAAIVVTKPFAAIDNDTVDGDATAQVSIIVGVDAPASDLKGVTFAGFAGTLGIQVQPLSSYSRYDPNGTDLTSQFVQDALTELWGMIPAPSTAIVESVVAGDRITVDNTDPANPIVTADDQEFVLDIDDFVDSPTIDFIEAPNSTDLYNIGVVTPSNVTILNSGSQRKGVSKFTADKGGKLVSYHVNSLVNSGTSKVKALVYSDNAGAPDALLALSDEIIISNTTLQINNLTFSGAQQITITEGGDYWIGYINEPSGGNTFGISTNNVANGIYRTSDTYSDGPTNPFGTPSIEPGVIDGYITIQANGISAQLIPNLTRPDNTSIVYWNFISTADGTTWRMGYYDTGNSDFIIHKSGGGTSPFRIRASDSTVLIATALLLNAQTASRIAILDGSKNLISADTATYPSLTELAFLKGVTSAIQTQLGNKQPLDSDLTTIAGLTATTDNFIVAVASAWASRTPAQVKTTLSLNNVDNTSNATERAATRTLTNARITKRVTSLTSSATPTINTDNCDAVDITALATNITSMTTNLTGTPANKDTLVFEIKDSGSARTISWGASFVAGGVALPTTTVAGKILTVGFMYSTANALNKWRCIASVQEA